jgi:hypothetical protein
MADIQQSCGAQLPAILTKQEAAQFLRCTTRYLERLKDANEWTQKGGARVDDLQHALDKAQPQQRHQRGTGSVC